jgi:hypothetical protein
MAEQKKPVNALQAVLDRKVVAQSQAPVPLSVSTTPLGSKRQERKATHTPEGVSSNYLPPSRTGKRLIGGHFPPEVAKHLKILAAEEETSIQALLEEALDLLFVKKGKGHIGRV